MSGPLATCHDRFQQVGGLPSGVGVSPPGVASKLVTDDKEGSFQAIVRLRYLPFDEAIDRIDL